MAFGLKKIRTPIKIIILVLVLISATVGLLCLRSALHEADQPYRGIDAGQRIALIIPGLNDPEDNYKKIEGYYSDVGITPVFIHMDWLKSNFKDLIEGGGEEIDKVIALYPNREVYFFGFSFGAVIALSTEEKYASKGTILCSLSPIFKDDLKSFPGLLKKIILPPSYKSIPEETTVFLYGDHDFSLIRSDETINRRQKIYSKSEFTMIKGAEHKIAGQAYLEQIRLEIYKLRNEDRNG